MLFIRFPIRAETFSQPTNPKEIVEFIEKNLLTSPSQEHLMQTIMTKVTSLDPSSPKLFLAQQDSPTTFSICLIRPISEGPELNKLI